MFVSPMLLDKYPAPVNDKSWITELKLDGIRLLLSKFDNKIKLYTRHNNEISSRFPELINLDIPNGTILDGELIVANPSPDFDAVMRRFQSNYDTTPVQFVVFDIIYYKGEKVTNIPLIDRKALVEEAVPSDNYNIVPSKWIYGNAVEYFELTKQNQLEGIVQKKATSPYSINARSPNWRKVIAYSYYDFVLISGVRKEKFGVLLTSKEGKSLGIMEFAPPEVRKEIYRNSKLLKIEENKDFVFLDPLMKCKVKYRNLTKNGKLRIPSFVEWVS
ncbi:RNA ligase family protein [Metabacillus herbersteinensis]|uniref:RNA ligase family protein n=1 Tax=Metabacillus herbersteinensis TaxID=283816 RepID=A0ABV6GJN8_9BACI